MAKLANKIFTFHEWDGFRRYEMVECRVRVDSKGMFTVELPEYIDHAYAAKQLKSWRDSDYAAYKDASIRGVGRGNRAEYWGVEASTLERCSDIVHKFLKEYFLSWRVETLYIFYSCDTDYMLYELPDGGLVFSHYEGRLQGVSHHDLKCVFSTADRFNHGQNVKIGLSACVVRCTTFKLPDGTARDTFERVDETDSILKDFKYGRLLAGLKFGNISYLDEHRRQSEEEKLRLLPYSEETAKFFYEMLQALTNMARQLQEFLSKRENIQKAVAARVPKLLNPFDEALLKNMRIDDDD